MRTVHGAKAALRLAENETLPMFVITVDAYSGRDDPSYLVTGKEAQEVLRELLRNRGAFGTHDITHPRLGFRGLIVEFVADDVSRKHGLPHQIHLGTGNAQSEGKAQEIVERLLTQLVGQKGLRRERNDPIEMTHALARHLVGEMDMMSAGTPDLTVHDLAWRDGLRVPGTEYVWGHLTPSAPNDPHEHKHGQKDTLCPIEVRDYDPDHWNGPAHVFRNNCYNYATNRRTNTRAQPGWASGVDLQTFDCADVTQAAVKDGAKKRGDCSADDEKPRWLMALVNDPVKHDYHWYRLHADGFWGHKPGNLPATNVDNSKRLVANPEFCDRGSYLNFCGYFYAPNSMRVE